MQSDPMYLSQSPYVGSLSQNGEAPEFASSNPNVTNMCTNMNAANASTPPTSGPQPTPLAAMYQPLYPYSTPFMSHQPASATPSYVYNTQSFQPPADFLPAHQQQRKMYPHTATDFDPQKLFYEMNYGNGRPGPHLNVSVQGNNPDRSLGLSPSSRTTRSPPSSPSSPCSSFPLKIPDDLPNFRTMHGIIIILIVTMIVNSLFICIGRTDFNLCFYIIGYYIWCIESTIGDGNWESINILRTYVYQYTVALCLSCLVDLAWLFIGFSTWVCHLGSGALCFVDPEDQKLKWLYGLHSFVLYLSLLNFFIKVLVISLSFTWTQRQRKQGSSPNSPVQTTVTNSPR